MHFTRRFLELWLRWNRHLLLSLSHRRGEVVLRPRISDHACVIKITSLSNILHMWVLVSLLWSSVSIHLGFLGLIFLIKKCEVVWVFLLAIRSLSRWLGVHL